MTKIIVINGIKYAIIFGVLVQVANEFDFL